MAAHRVFVSQETLDIWLADERVAVEGDVMTLRPEGQKFKLHTAFHFLREVADGGDDQNLVGKVKDLEQLTALGGEHCSDSVILGESAYEIVEGFIGQPLHSARSGDVARGSSLESAAAAALGEGPPTGELDLLGRFFASTR
jgi:hypothetical protein